MSIPVDEAYGLGVCEGCGGPAVWLCGWTCVTRGREAPCAGDEGRARYRPRDHQAYIDAAQEGAQGAVSFARAQWRERVAQWRRRDTPRLTDLDHAPSQEAWERAASILGVDRERWIMPEHLRPGCAPPVAF